MTVGDLIKEFRIAHGLSQRQFANRCGLTNGYISMLERGSNPKTNEPITPSITALKSISSAMMIPLHELLSKADDIPISMVPQEDVTDDVDVRLNEFVELFSQLTEEQQDFIISSMKGLVNYND